jgi:hypothetical protein
MLNQTDINWITNSNILSSSVKDKLQFIHKNKNQDSNRYIKIVYNTADFNGEKEYNSIGFPGAHLRLLMLARFWNIINYFAPYKYLADNLDDVLRQFIPQFINSTIALPEFPGLFKLEPSPKIGQVNGSAFKGKVIILCNESTQSQGEYSCMVLQTIPGAVTIGSQTAGHDGVVTNIPLDNNITISFSGYGIYYPDKRQTQQVGIKIDIPVKETSATIKDNDDEILQRALQYLQDGK